VAIIALTGLRGSPNLGQATVALTNGEISLLWGTKEQLNWAETKVGWNGSLPTSSPPGGQHRSAAAKLWAG